MITSKTIVKNTAVLFLADIISHVLSFFLIVAIARYLGDVGLGKYSFAFSFVGLFIVFSDFGLLTLMTREIAKDKKNTEKYFRNILSLKLLLGIFGLILPCIIIVFMNKSAEEILIVVLAAVAMFFNYFGYTFRSLFQAYEIMEYDAVIKVIERVVAVSLGILVLRSGYGLIVLISVLILSYFIFFISGAVIASKKIIEIRFAFDFSFWKRILKTSFPFWFTLLFLSIYFSIDTVMLTLMKDYAVTGWYSAARKLVAALSFIPIIIITAVYPAMSRLYISSKKVLSLLFKKSFYYLFVLAFPIGIATTLLANRFILFIYKQEFINSGIALQILIWAEVFLFINYIIGYLLNAINKQKLFTYSAGICVIINIILNFLLIPRYSYIGAGIATVATEFVNFGLLYYFSARNGFKLNLIKLMAKPVIAGSVMGGSIFFLSELRIFLLVPVAAIIYFAVLFLIKGFGKEEYNLIQNFVCKKN